MARLLIVVLALVWTQFPFGSGAASEEGEQALALCCAWGKSLDDGILTYSVSSPDVPSAQVIRSAIREWDGDLTAVRFTEVPVGAPADVTVRFTPGQGRTEGQAVTSFTRRGLISKVEITIQGAVAPGNSGGLGQIAKHEFGHALGLGHTNYEGNLMSPAVSPDPQPVPACVVQGVIEANRWKMIAPALKKPVAPRLSRVPC
ncbi:MAG TPA: matrixin family metalloprotease [Acidimicrobiia bacterium]|nr:matrixin family metalloprotease [Acidimicrobiia bacterium]